MITENVTMESKQAARPGKSPATTSFHEKSWSLWRKIVENLKRAKTKKVIDNKKSKH